MNSKTSKNKSIPRLSKLRVHGYLTMRAILRDLEHGDTPVDLVERCAREVDARWRALRLHEQQALRAKFDREFQESDQWRN